MYHLHTRFTVASRPPWTLGARSLATALIFLLVTAPHVCAQNAAQDTSNAPADIEQRRQAALQWLDDYLKDAVLMSPEDITKIHDAVARMSPSQLERWLKDTEQLREFVEDPSWQETKRWLREYLRIQAVYSDKEIQQLRDDIYRADADEMLAIMKRIQAKHDSLVWMHQASQQTRAAEVKNRTAHIAQQAAAASKARSASKANVPLFGSGFAKGKKPSKGKKKKSKKK